MFRAHSSHPDGAGRESSVSRRGEDAMAESWFIANFDTATQSASRGAHSWLRVKSRMIRLKTDPLSSKHRQSTHDHVLHETTRVPDTLLSVHESRFSIYQQKHQRFDCNAQHTPISIPRYILARYGYAQDSRHC